MPREGDRDLLDDVLIGGREQVPIVVVDHDEQWPGRYALVRDRLRAALGAAALRVEHIGSTSVPGLAAKPIIDVLVVVPDVEDDAAFAPLLESAGFVLRVREPEHRMFRTPSRDVHVHLYEPDHEAVAAYLDLRDRLRRDADDRALYERTKRLLATRTWTDMNEYADAKTEVIVAILGRARDGVPGRSRPTAESPEPAVRQRCRGSHRAVVLVDGSQPTPGLRWSLSPRGPSPAPRRAPARDGTPGRRRTGRR